MSSTLQLQDDAGAPITSWNFGAINGGASSQQKFRVANVGDQSATSVELSASRIASNDGLDFVLLALDSGGNPGAYASTAIQIGTIAALAYVEFWIKVLVPSGATPAGNPRQFQIVVDYIGT